jgi:hypothetical protein
LATKKENLQQSPGIYVCVPLIVVFGLKYFGLIEKCSKLDGCIGMVVKAIYCMFNNPLIGIQMFQGNEYFPFTYTAVF